MDYWIYEYEQMCLKESFEKLGMDYDTLVSKNDETTEPLYTPLAQPYSALPSLPRTSKPSQFDSPTEQID